LAHTNISFARAALKRVFPPLIPQGYTTEDLLPSHPTFPGERRSYFVLSSG
jgi:hypothetical protein